MGLNCELQTSSQVPTTTQACWKRCPGINFDQQDNSYQCACAAFSMATDALKKKIAETTLAKIFGTTTAGTGQSQVLSGLEKVEFKGTPVNVVNMPIEKLAELVGSSDHGVCAHIQLKDSKNWKQSMVYDYQGKQLYQTFRGGHWECIAAVDPCRGLVLMGDPARGMQYVWWEQLWYATRYNEMMNLGSGFVVVTRK